MASDSGTSIDHSDATNLKRVPREDIDVLGNVISCSC